MGEISILSTLSLLGFSALCFKGPCDPFGIYMLVFYPEIRELLVVLSSAQNGGGLMWHEIHCVCGWKCMFLRNHYFQKWKQKYILALKDCVGWHEGMADFYMILFLFLNSLIFIDSYLLLFLTPQQPHHLCDGRGRASLPGADRLQRREQRRVRRGWQRARQWNPRDDWWPRSSVRLWDKSQGLRLRVFITSAPGSVSWGAVGGVWVVIWCRCIDFTG